MAQDPAPDRVLRAIEHTVAGDQPLLLDLHLPSSPGPHPVTLAVALGFGANGVILAAASALALPRAPVRARQFTAPA